MKKTIVFLIFTFCLCQESFSQGCSDAGICTVGSNVILEENLRNTIDAGINFAHGEADVSYISPYVSYTRRLNSKIALNAKVTFSSASGTFGTRAAFGDAYLTGNYYFRDTGKKQWAALLGWKFPFTASNLKINGFSIPLDYQSSLGTFDLLLGTTLRYTSLDFNLAFQIPVFNNNKNSYFDEYSPSDDFSSTNLFERRPDALFRTSYTFKTLRRKLSLKPNILLIYHLGEDRYQDIFGKTVSIRGSDGLTVNGSLITSYAINHYNSLELSMAAPFVVREKRPDGLTRSFVLGIQFRTQF